MQRASRASCVVGCTADPNGRRRAGAMCLLGALASARAGPMTPSVPGDAAEAAVEAANVTKVADEAAVAIKAAVATKVADEAAVATEAADEPCQSSATATDTTERLKKVRELMAANHIDAYIVPSDDEHGSEYTATPDHRRQWLSGFMGSVGDLVVTRTKALLWTDSRYWVQAARELDCSWTLMRKGEAGVPTIEKWLQANVPHTSQVGADPRMLSYNLWASWSNYLSTNSGPALRPIDSNLVDEAWGADKPDYPDTPIEPLADKYTGETWQSKVAKVRNAMRAAGHDLLVLSALDDCAWLLNLRSGEVPYTPVFRCYIVLGVDDKGAVTMDVFLPKSKVTKTVNDHLCDPDITTRIHGHQDIWKELPALAAASKSVALTMPVVYHTGASYKLFTAARGETTPSKHISFIASPVLYMKATKNQVEAMGMRRAHVKDAVALIEMLSILYEEVPAGKYWDELKVVEALDKLRWQQENSRGPSFDTISAFGVNSALPHYQPSNQTNQQITTEGLFMLDSGGQYSEGTTDVTRTVHFGTPRAVEIEVYTRLLKGCIDLASVKFPQGYTMQNLEVLLRGPLFGLGLQYGHGSTHGIGHFLTVHESFDYEYKKNFFGSQEPGYYREGDFGMRLENIVQVVPAEVMYKSVTKFLTFETTTLVPYERKLINTAILSQDELKWLNLYNQRIRISVGPELLRQNKQKVYKWLLEQTQPYC